MLAPGALACSNCHALVHAQSLEQLAAAARMHEERAEFTIARELWVKALAQLAKRAA